MIRTDVQHRSAANFSAPQSEPSSAQSDGRSAPYRLIDEGGGRRLAAASTTATTDYFSTAWQEAAELRPAMLVRRQRDSVRPIPLRFVQPKLGNLTPTEHWFARLIGSLLAIGVVAGGTACILLFRLLNPQPLRIASPSLQRLINAAEAMSVRDTAAWSHSLSHGLLPLTGVKFCISLVVCAFVLFTIARRMAGVFGGLIVVLLTITSVATRHHLPVVEPVALAGIGLLIAGWRSSGVGRSLAGSVIVGLAASIAHSQLLLLPLLVIVAMDLPWKWSWLMPVLWVAPIGLLGWSDAKFFGVMPDVGSMRLAAAVSAHQRLSDLLMLLHNRNDPAWILAPLSVAGIGLVARVDWRWALLMVGMSLPAAGEFLLHETEAAGLSMLILPPLFLASVWTISRSSLATGLITATVCGLSLWIALGNG